LITITNKQIHNVIDYDYIESNHDYKCVYICLITSSERKKENKTHLLGMNLMYVSGSVRYEQMQ